MANQQAFDLGVEISHGPALEERLVPAGDFQGCPSYVLDIPETIPQLGYASHQFFRYYGKFPSVVGREIIRRHASGEGAVLDCYSGSGTTQVEAQIAGLPSYGVDINPLAVLASNVKTDYYDYEELEEAAARVLAHARQRTDSDPPPEAKPKKLKKWFRPGITEDLARLRLALLDLDESRVRSFLITCYLAIVRRCSNAYDGEVRPHENKNKDPRAPFEAFRDKFQDMMAGLRELDQLRPHGVASATVIGDNRDASAYGFINGKVDLVVSHPPYLNSFNYLPVFSLELMWSHGFPEVWQGWNLKTVRALEHQAHPATNEEVLNRYYEDFFDAMKSSTSFLRKGGVTAVVIGDSTIRGQLEPVHVKMWEGLEDRGLEPMEIWYRTTHYGIGKYAYAHRADYHGQAEKRDAIMFFRK